ncbi:MAG: carbohydrate ABC transporter permease [Acholeplasmataceae bacterium]
MKEKRLPSKSLGEKSFNIFNTILLIFLGLVAIYPIWFIFIGAFSDPAAYGNNPSFLLPRGFSFSAFATHLKNVEIWNAFGNTFFITIVGSAVSICLTILGAYVLARRDVPGVKILTIIVMLTIWLRPGMVAIYQNIDMLGLKGTMFGVILPFALSAFNIILLRTGFMGIPRDVLEAAEIDGANHFQILTKIMIPNALPSITTISLFHVIDRWNGYFWAELVLDQERYPLQVFIKESLTRQSPDFYQTMANAYSLILISVLPMLIIFPMIQKVFKKGIMSGSIK